MGGRRQRSRALPDSGRRDLRWLTGRHPASPTSNRSRRPSRTAIHRREPGDGARPSSAERPTARLAAGTLHCPQAAHGRRTNRYRCRSRSSSRAVSPGSTRRSSPSRCTSPAGCPRSTSSGCPTPRSRSRAIACAPRCRTRSSSSRRARSPSTSRPADLPKESGRFDLPIAIGILAATGQIPGDRARALRIRRRARAGRRAAPDPRRAADGAVRAARRPRVRAAGGERGRGGARARRHRLSGARRCSRVCAHLTGRELLAPLAPRAGASRRRRDAPDLADVRGQAHAKRALTIAAAGAHSLLMIGPPGTGKSMLAQRLPGLLPPLSEDEALAVAAIASLAGRFSPAAWGVAAVSRAASHGERRRAGRRRQRSAARRDLARASRRAVPRRAAGVGSPRARGAARAARVRA